MEKLSFENTAIVACGTMRPELNHLKDQGFLDTPHLFYTTPGLPKGCGKCAEACPSTAMELMGQKWDVDALVTELLKDRAFFETSSGGVTISGGESTMQKDFVAALLQGLNRHGIHTAVDTCGVCATTALDAILPHANLVLFDLKLIEPDRHRFFTGTDNAKILENLAHTVNLVKNHLHPEALWIRTPIIPGATDTDDNIQGIGNFLATLPPGAITRWELCAFNNLCADKYARLGRTWDFAGISLMTSDKMEHLAAVARSSGIDPAIVIWTGATILKILAKNDASLAE
ncbi:MAG: glycyl-radical enzyme activating protein [Desulfotignum sp.]